MRFVPKIDGFGKWAAFDTQQNYMLPGVWYDTRDEAEAYADRLNAIDEGEPDRVIAELRTDSDRLRGGGR
jgi:hypothetical protein